MGNSFLTSGNVTIIIIVLALLILFYIAIYFTVKKIKAIRALAIGKNGEKKVKAVLDKFARKNAYKTIHDLYLPLYDKTTQIDHIVIGEFGVLVVETKSYNGEIYGNETDNNWLQIIGNKKNKLYNPLKQNKAHIDCMRHFFNKSKIYNVQIDSLVVFSGNNIFLNIPKALPVITISFLKKFLRKSRYRSNNKVDIQKVYDCLISNQVTDKKLLKNHNSNVKKMSRF